MNNKILLSAIMAAGVVAMSGCSDDDPVATGGTGSGTAPQPITRVAPLASQTAQITITNPTTSPVVTVDSQPADFALAGAATTNGTDVSLSLDMTNNAGRILFGAKVVVDTISDSDNTNAPTSSSTGTIAASSATYAGFGDSGVIADGETESSADDITFSDADGLDNPLVITFTIPTNHSLAYGQDDDDNTGIEILDVAADDMHEVETATVAYRGNDDDDGAFNEGVSSPDGQYILGGSRNTASVIVMNTATEELMTIPVPEKGSAGHVPKVVMSPDTLWYYAIVHVGDHQYRWESGGGIAQNYIVKINSNTLEVDSYAEISGDSGVEGDRVRDIDLTDDGGLAVIGTVGAGEVTIVDTSDLSVVKTLKAASSYARRVAISGDGSTVYVANMDDNDYSYDGNLEMIDVDAETSSTLVLVDQDTGRPQCLDFGPDGRLYFCRSNNAMSIIDTTGTDPEVSIGSDVEAIAFDMEGDFYYALDGGDVDQYDITDDSQLATTADASMGQENLIISAY